MFKIIFLAVFPLMVLADISLNGLPLITNVTQVQTNDTFPIVNNFGPPTTKKLYIRDILNVTAFQNKFATLAPLANPIFTGTVVGNFAGPLNGTATNVTGVVAIANGGTGASTKDNGLNNLLPVQTGLSGKALTTNGSSTLWSSVVNTVNGYFGNVILTKSDIGLGNVDNTADIDKPISAADRVALNLKAPLLSPALTGIPTAPTATLATNTNQIATTAFVLANAPTPPPSANLYLSNLLSPTTVNVDLVPDLDGIHNIGSNATRWNNAYFHNTVTATGFSSQNGASFFSFGVYTTTPSGVAAPHILYETNASPIAVVTENNAIANTGALLFETGSATGSTFNSGDISFLTGNSLSGSRGKIILNGSLIDATSKKIINVATPTLATDAANKAYVDAATPPAGANKSLSNLTAPTSINQALLPDFDVNQNLGSFSNRWGNIYGLGIAYLGKVTLIDASNGSKGNFLARSKTVDGILYTGPEIAAGSSTYVDVALSTNPDSGTDAIATGSAIIFTGDKQSGTGNSGAIKLYTGTSLGGARGKIILSGSFVDVNSSKIINVATATNPTDAANKAYVDLAIGSGSGANTSLSNLAVVTSINSDLVPATDNLKNLGAGALRWGTINGVSLAASSSTDVNDLIILQKRPVSALFPHAVDSKIIAGYGASPLAIVTQNNSIADTIATLPISILTGNKTAGTGNSGNINLQTGTSTGGIRGVIALNSTQVELSGASTTGNGRILLPADNAFFRIQAGEDKPNSYGLSTPGSSLRLQTAGAPSGTGKSGDVLISTGGTAGSTGNIVLSVGGASGGTRGRIVVDNGGSTAGGEVNLDMSSNKILNVGTPINPTDAVNKAYSDLRNYQISLSSGVFATGSAAPVDVTNLSVTIVSHGRPIMVGVIPDTSANNSAFLAYVGGGRFAYGSFNLVRGATTINQVVVSAGSSVNPVPNIYVPPNGFILDPVPAGTYTYKVQIFTSGGNGSGVQLINSLLAAYEL